MEVTYSRKLYYWLNEVTVLQTNKQTINISIFHKSTQIENCKKGKTLDDGGILMSRSIGLTAVSFWIIHPDFILEALLCLSLVKCLKVWKFLKTYFFKKAWGKMSMSTLARAAFGIKSASEFQRSGKLLQAVAQISPAKRLSSHFHFVPETPDPSLGKLWSIF